MRFNKIKEVYKDLVGDYYSPFKIKEVLNEIDDLIDKNNLQFVEHNVEETIEKDKVSLKFTTIVKTSNNGLLKRMYQCKSEQLN